jgi:hypothetical protein
VNLKPSVSDKNLSVKNKAISMAAKGVVSWDRIFYASVGLVVLGLLLGFFSKTLSFVTWIILISLWTEIPGFINENLIEINLSEFFFVLLAIHFGGFWIGILGIGYTAMLPVFSRMWKPTFAIKGAIAFAVAIGTSPFFYYNVYNQNLLWTLYTYTAILFGLMAIISLFLTTGEFFQEIKLLAIALPLAYLTNLLYVFALENWAIGMFLPTARFPGVYKIVILVAMGGIGAYIYVNKKGK